MTICKNLKNSVLVLLFGSILTLNAQIGIGAQLELQHLIFPEGLSTNDLSNRFSIQYLVRLKSARVEFLPGISFGNLSTLVVIGDPQISYTYKEWSPQIQLPILVYPFDFKNDCNCPTFKKNGNPVSKGLHIMALTGFRYQMRAFELITEKEWLIPMGLGLGMDFGLSPFFTLSPFMLFQTVLNDQSTLLSGSKSIGHQEFVFGLRGLFHKDSRKFKRRR